MRCFGCLEKFFLLSTGGCPYGIDMSREQILKLTSLSSSAG